jgi:hypothetical protein
MGFEQYKTSIIRNISQCGFASNNLAGGPDWGNMWNDTVDLLWFSYLGWRKDCRNVRLSFRISG